MNISGVAGGTNLHNLHGLDLPGVLDVRTSAQINERTAAVDRTVLSLDQVVDVVQLILAVVEHLLQILFRNLQTIEGLLLFEDFGRLGIERWPICLSDNTS